MQQMQSNTALFGGLHPLDTQSMSTGCVRVEGKQLLWWHIINNNYVNLQMNLWT